MFSGLCSYGGKKASNPDGGKYVFPILFALLKNKNRATYDKLFGMIRAIVPNFEPNNINVDFEQAVINSLRETFPDAKSMKNDPKNIYMDDASGIARKIRVFRESPHYQEYLDSLKA
uniref:MULE transposase domain-containing protein n=1 Tax=Ditylenchus dipsaci TaxID=166011 RepID=A0A915E070_9BILA